MSHAYTIIDAHAHIFPTKIAEKATTAIGRFYDIPMDHPIGSSEALLQSGEAIGVSRYLVSSAATTPAQVQNINDYIHAECLANPQLFGFGTLHPRMEDAERELDRLCGMGLHGIKFHPDFQTFSIDEPDVIPLYRRIAEKKLPILFHMGDSRYEYSRPIRLQRVLEQVPELTVIAPHFGGYERWEEAVEVLCHPNLYFDTSSALFKLSPDTAVEIIRHFGADRFMFGSDFPMWDHAEELARFLALPLTEQEKEQILSKTFTTLFG